MSSNRNPANGGYTQQRRNSDDSKYTNPTGKTVVSDEDDMFFSSKRNEFTETDLQPESMEPHDTEINHYDAMSKAFEETGEQREEKGHTMEFVASNILEFSRHMFARKYANRIRLYLFGIVFFDFICLFFDILIDASRITPPFMIGYTVILLVLSVVTRKTYRKLPTTCIAFLAIIFSVIMIVMISNIDKTARAPELYFIYIPLAAQDVLCMRLSLVMSKYQDTWDMYKKTGKVPIEI